MGLPKPCQQIADEIYKMQTQKNNHFLRSYPPSRNLPWEELEAAGPQIITPEQEKHYMEHSLAVQELEEKIKEADERLHDCIQQNSKP